MQIWTFWEPRECIPYCWKLCLKTWQKNLPEYSINILDFSNVGKYIDLQNFMPGLFSKQMNLMLISDVIRAAVLEKYGGIWLDIDTIILDRSAKKFFEEDEEHDTVFFGDTEKNVGTYIAFINAKAHSNFLKSWLEYIKEKLAGITDNAPPFTPNVMGNDFTDLYCVNHPNEIKIISADKSSVIAESFLYPVQSVEELPDRYINYYFVKSYHIEDIAADMLFLHNSWTPEIFKNISEEDFLRCDFTMANILMEVLGMKRNLKAESIKFAAV